VQIDIISKAGDINKLSPVFKEDYRPKFTLSEHTAISDLVECMDKFRWLQTPMLISCLPKPSFIEIYDFIIADLNQAFEIAAPIFERWGPVLNLETPNRGNCKSISCRSLSYPWVDTR